MDHWVEKLLMGTMCRPRKFTSVEEMSTPFELAARMRLIWVKEGHVRLF